MLFLKYLNAKCLLPSDWIITFVFITLLATAEPLISWNLSQLNQFDKKILDIFEEGVRKN